MLRPPLGVAILGFLALINGVGDLLVGLNLMGIVTFGPVQSGTGVWISGLFIFITGLIFIAVAWAAWTLRPWAWLFGMIMAIFGLFDAVLIAISTGSVAWGLAAALVSGVVLWYLNQPDIKAAFLGGGGFGDADVAERIKAERADTSNQ
jgi:hypothetical protein